jgi:hypothetical protein
MRFALFCGPPSEQFASFHLLRPLDLFDQLLELIGADSLPRQQRLQRVHQEQLEAYEFRECVLCNPLFRPASDRSRQKFPGPFAGSPSLSPSEFLEYCKFGFCETNPDLPAAHIGSLRRLGSGLVHWFGCHLFLSQLRGSKRYRAVAFATMFRSISSFQMR